MALMTSKAATPTSVSGSPTSDGGGGGGGEGSGSAPEGTKSKANERGAKTCCFCWCCCCSCSCLTVKNNDDASRGKDKLGTELLSGDESPPSLEEIRSWGESFDKLMKNPGGRRVFREFLKCEYSEENILFWLACEELKKENDSDVVKDKARLIYEDFISILSPKEVSLDSRVRDTINADMVSPTQHTFDEAQVQIYTLMHRDSYPRFVNSPLFRQLAQLNTASRKESSA